MKSYRKILHQPWIAHLTHVLVLSELLIQCTTKCAVHFWPKDWKRLLWRGYWQEKSALHFTPWQTCSFQHQLDFSGKQSATLQLLRVDSLFKYVNHCLRNGGERTACFRCSNYCVTAPHRGSLGNQTRVPIG